MAAFTLIFTPTTAVYGRSGYNKDGDDEEKDSGRSGYNKDGNDDDETQNKGRSGYNKDEWLAFFTAALGRANGALTS
ncbi:uncharacterized protein LY79DRAFT_699481 [Colletotrichum navitas]|uniref:Uncharacterized protein n=1 Tax=Colletotrichum navitas TaxID=681940 RepID=A0AAD8VC36_9PEZI|nr:uncharacterized protein LY79DRAFT_699481 [Colletotrichum navitas]KAK1599646.1 hypothetical protein LY79DRAFT_699481 [Colletotrichum navitas]